MFGDARLENLVVVRGVELECERELLSAHELGNALGSHLAGHQKGLTGLACLWGLTRNRRSGVSANKLLD